MSGGPVYSLFDKFKQIITIRDGSKPGDLLEDAAQTEDGSVGGL